MSMATIQTLLRTILLDGSSHMVGVLLLLVIQLWEDVTIHASDPPRSPPTPDPPPCPQLRLPSGLLRCGPPACQYAYSLET